MAFQVVILMMVLGTSLRADTPDDPCNLAQFAPSFRERNEHGNRGSHENVNVPSLWGRNEPIYLMGPNHTQLPLTFSFDGEITFADMLRIIQRNATSRRQFEEISRRFGAISLQYIAAIGEYHSLAQARHFGVNPSAPNREHRTEFFLHELQPNVFHQVYRNGQHESFRTTTDLQHIRPFFRQMLSGLSSNVSIGDHDIELRHESYALSPAAFRNRSEHIRRELNRTASRRGQSTDVWQAHFHLGIPSQAVSQGSFFAISRAIETRMILTALLAFPENTSPVQYYATTLRQFLDLPIDLSGEGFIRARTEHHSEPIPAHDLEIRQRVSFDQGYDLLEFATTLAQNHPRLHQFPSFNSSAHVIDRVTVRLHGALRYVGLVLSMSRDPHDQSVARGLIAWADRIEREYFGSRIPTTMRVQIARFLESTRTLERLTPEAFMAP